MPVVPIRQQDLGPPPMPSLESKYLLMAASAMHDDGRLIKPGSGPRIPATVQEPLRDQPKSEPELYPPSNGQRNGPAMMT